MATALSVGRIEEILGGESDLLEHQCKTIPKETLHLPGPDSVDRLFALSDRPTRVLSESADAVGSRAARRHRLRVDSAGRPGHRAFGGSVVRAQSDLFRSREHRQARDRRRLQRRRVDARRAGSGRAEVRAQNSVRAQGQPQRVSVVPQHLRSDSLRQRQAGVRHGRDRCRGHDLFRLRGVKATAGRDFRDVSARTRARDCAPSSGATCAIPPSRPKKPITTWPPT